MRKKKRKGIATSHTSRVHTVFTQNGGRKAFQKHSAALCGVMKTSSLSVHKLDFVQYVCRNKATASFLLTFTNDVSG